MKLTKLISVCNGKKWDFEKSILTADFIEKIVLIYADEPAVTYDDFTINYEKLNEKANQLARFLIEERNIYPGNVIGIYFKPSIDLIVSILAIMKTGAIYLPLDIKQPEEYFNFIINDAKPKIILTNTTCSFKKEKFINITAIDSKKYSKNNLSIQFSQESAAYILYTSGSTGQPKGVVIPHRALINHMLWMQNEFHFEKNDKILLKTPITFDPSIWEIFIPLFSGAELVIAPAGAHIDTHQLVTLIKKYQITTMQFVPFILHNFLNHLEIRECKSLKRVFVGGESLLNKTKKLFFSTLDCQLINLYGPTETTIEITFHEVKNLADNFKKNYIGKPIYNTELYVFNADFQLCKHNEQGELYVGGKCLALGYLNNLPMTQKNFVNHPFSPNKTLYKTGDIVRYTKNGLFEYIGRKDKQIKINGVRVELEAIIAKIMAQKNVAYCYINKNQEKTCAYLICYIVPEKRKTIDISAIKNVLFKAFSQSIIPRQFYVVEEIPLLSNGKVDVNALKKKTTLPKKPTRKFLINESTIQANLLKVCRQLLNNNAIQIDNNLYDSGIDSLFSLLLIDHVKKCYHVNLMIHELLSLKTIKNLSRLITKKLNGLEVKSDTNTIIIPLKASGSKTPLFLIHPIGGTIFWYTHLAKYFDPDRPLYAIQDPGIELEEHVFNRLEEMASFYFTQITNVQPSGPYIIGGASFGATVAVEISHHLSRDDVITIPVLDGWAIYPEDLKDEGYFRESMRKQQNDWEAQFGIHGYTEFEKLFSLQKQRLDLLYQYKMKVVNHPLLLFKVQEIMDIFLPINCHDNNWKKYARNRLEIVNIEGNHETMFHELYVKKLAVTLSSLLDREEKIFYLRKLEEHSLSHKNQESILSL